MKDIGSGHGGKTPAQVAINWVMCKGAIPIVGETCACVLLVFSCCVRSCAKARSLLSVRGFVLVAAVFPLRSVALYCTVLRKLLHVLTSLRPCLSYHVLLCFLRRERGGGRTLDLTCTRRQLPSLVDTSPLWPLSSGPLSWLQPLLL